jgi:hypothetical protein
MDATESMIKRIAFEMVNFANFRIRALLIAVEPD